jgi:hypothetical protein
MRPAKKWNRCGGSSIAGKLRLQALTPLLWYRIVAPVLAKDRGEEPAYPAQQAVVLRLRLGGRRGSRRR